jgi:ABC-type methionine transport system ATPase subunit
MTSGELLLAQSVTASRPGEKGLPERILQKTTLGVAPGEVLSVAGPSGSGKSTLLRLFNRLLEPDSGQVMLSG